MRAVIMEAPSRIEVTEREDPRIVEETDAVVRLTATCIRSSDLWPYRGVEPADHLMMGHEYVGVVEEIGSGVNTVKPGDFVVGSFVIPTAPSCPRSASPYRPHPVAAGGLRRAGHWLIRRRRCPGWP